MSAPPKQDIVGGALWSLLTCFLFTLIAGIARHITQSINPMEVMFFRNVFGLIAMLPWIVGHWRETMASQQIPLHCGRAALGVFSMSCWFGALAYISVAEVTALGFTAPLFATVLAIVLLKEEVRLRRWSAVLIGFAGAMLILRPGIESFGIGQSLALVNALFAAGGVVFIKRLTLADSPAAIVSWQMILMVPLSLLPALFFWTTPDGMQLFWLSSIGFLAALGQYAMTRAYSLAEATALLPIDFSRLVFATILGIALFDESPDLWTYVGAGVIFLSSIYIARREAQVARERGSARPAAETTAAPDGKP